MNSGLIFSELPLRILCITSFSAFPTQLNQQVTSANLSEIGVMQRFPNRLLKYSLRSRSAAGHIVDFQDFHFAF